MRPFLRRGAYVKDMIDYANFFFATCEVLNGATSLFKFRHTPFVTHIRACNRGTLLLKCGGRLRVTAMGVSGSSVLLQALRRVLSAPIHVLRRFLRTDLAGDGPLLRPTHLCSLFRA